MWRGRQGHDRRDDRAGRTEAGHLAGIVGEQAHGSNTEFGEDRGGLGVVAGIDRQAECDVGVDGVGPVVLSDIGAKLVDEADAPSLVAGRVHEDAAPLRGDHPEPRTQLDATVTSQRSEGITGEAFGMDPHEHVVAVVDVAHHHRHVDMARRPLERVDVEHAERRR